MYKKVYARVKKSIKIKYRIDPRKTRREKIKSRLYEALTVDTIKGEVFNLQEHIKTYEEFRLLIELLTELRELEKLTESNKKKQLKTLI